jgi:putative copper export protein
MYLPLFMTEVVIYSTKRGDKMEIIIILMLWLHYLATVMWIGGMAFNLLVLRPSMIVIDQNQRPVLGTTVLKRFIIFAWLSIVLLILTGISIAVRRGAFEDIFSTTYGIVLLSKHFVTLIMVLIVAWISFVLSAKLSSFAPKPETILILVKTNLSLGILVLLLTSVLRGA